MKVLSPVVAAVLLLCIGTALAVPLQLSKPPIQGNTTYTLYGTNLVDVVTGTVTAGVNIWMNQGLIYKVQYPGAPHTPANLEALQLQMQSYFPSGDFSILPASNTFAVPGYIDIYSYPAFQSNMGPVTDPSSVVPAAQAAVAGVGATDQQNMLQTLTVALQSGTTTLWGSMVNPDDASFVRSQVNQTNFFTTLPSMLTTGPVIGYPGAFPSWLASSMPQFAIQTADVNTYISQLTTYLQTVFNAAPNHPGMSGVLLVVDSPESAAGTPTVSAAFIQATYQVVVQTFQRRLFYTSYTDAGITAGAQNGAQVLINLPVVGTIASGLSVPLPSTLQALAQNNVYCGTSMAALGGAVETLFADFNGAPTHTYPNPNAVVYYPYSMYHFLPAAIVSAYETLFQQYFNSLTSVVSFYNTQSQAQLVAALTYRQAAAAGVQLAASTHAGIPFVFFGNQWMEGSLASTAFTNAGYFNQSLQVLQMMTINAARATGIDQYTGSIEVGKWADIVLLAENPLVHPLALRGVAAVYKFGFQQVAFPNHTIAIGVGLGAVGFAILLVLLFIVWGKCCSGVSERAKVGDIAASAL